MATEDGSDLGPAGTEPGADKNSSSKNENSDKNTTKIINDKTREKSHTKSMSPSPQSQKKNTQRKHPSKTLENLNKVIYVGWSLISY